VGINDGRDSKKMEKIMENVKQKLKVEEESYDWSGLGMSVLNTCIQGLVLGMATGAGTLIVNRAFSSDAPTGQGLDSERSVVPIRSKAV